MTIKKLKKISIGIILFMIFLECNMGYSKADTSSLIEPPPVCVYKSNYSAIKITMGNGTCEYYYVFASPNEFSEYNQSFVRLERFYNGRVMNPHPDIDYSDCSYDVISIINYWRLPSNWTECYFGVVCVNESSDLWSYPVISQKMSIPEGLEPPDPDPVDPDPVDPDPTPTPTSPSFEDFKPIFIILGAGAGLILLAIVANYIVIHLPPISINFLKKKKNSEIQKEPQKTSQTTNIIREIPIYKNKVDEIIYIVENLQDKYKKALWDVFKKVLESKKYISVKDFENVNENLCYFFTKSNGSRIGFNLDRYKFFISGEISRIIILFEEALDDFSDDFTDIFKSFLEMFNSKPISRATKEFFWHIFIDIQGRIKRKDYIMPNKN